MRVERYRDRSGSDGSDQSDLSDRSDGSDESDLSDRSDRSDLSDDFEEWHVSCIKNKTSYRRTVAIVKLRSFQCAQQVYDLTVLFCHRFLDKRSRTCDQMIQAARSGVQNIAEGSMASATSKKMELKLTGVARASLEELLVDYQDFLRQRHLPIWPKDSPQALAVRRKYKSDRSDRSDPSDPYGLLTASPEAAANTMICLVHQAGFLLGRQLERLEREFLTKGGFTERLYIKRCRWRRRG